jgi:transcriptional regulator with XRE-family HTH domain
MKTIFVERLKELIARENIKQKDLAKDVGITEAALSRYMSGERTPHGDTLCNLATALHTSTDYLLGRETKENFEKGISFEQLERLLGRSSKNLSNDEKQDLIRIILKTK